MTPLIIAGRMPHSCLFIDTIRAMMSTAYPGSRMSKGGGQSPLLMFSSLATLCLPFKDFYESAMLAGNNVEVAAFIDLCPGHAVRGHEHD